MKVEKILRETGLVISEAIGYDGSIVGRQEALKMKDGDNWIMQTAGAFMGSTGQFISPATSGGRLRYYAGRSLRKPRFENAALLVDGVTILAAYAVANCNDQCPSSSALHIGAFVATKIAMNIGVAVGHRLADSWDRHHLTS